MEQLAEMLADVCEDRRPGLKQVVAELHERHPTWGWHMLLSEAKVEWHRRNDRE